MQGADNHEGKDPKLAGHHLPHLSRLQKQELSLRSRGAKPEEIAASVHRAASSVRRDLDELQDAMLGMIGLEHDGWLAGRWCAVHDGCCLA